MRETDDEFSPRIGPNYQAEIPLNLSDSEEDVYDNPLSSAICLPVSVAWSDADAECLVLALFLFGKNFTLINKFLENKGMEEIISFYYGKFYKTEGYRRWSECRKLKGRKYMIAKKLSTKMRQNDLLARLIPHVSKQSQQTLLQVSKSYVEGKTCLEEYISSVKSIVGLGIFAQAVGIGKEKGVLTRSDLEPRKNSCGEFSALACKALSSLGPDDIIQSLTEGFQLSKTRSNELFWEAVWPRLLARGWHSEQPKNHDYLVFLSPGVKKFSRRKHVKGKHYYDSVKDVLSKVVAEPNIIVVEEEEVKERGSNEDDFSDDHCQCYLRRQSSTYDKYHTSLVHGRKPSDLRELKYVPSNTVEVNVNDGKRYKGHKYTRRVNHSKDMSESIKHRSTKLTAIDTNRLYERKLLKVKQKRYPPLKIEDATMTTDLLCESKGGSSTNDSPRIVEAKILIYGRKKTDSCRGVSGDRKACENPDNEANKIVDSQKNHQFNWRIRLGDSNDAAVPTKRRKLTACAKAENSSEGLGSEKGLLDANRNVCDPVSHKQNGSSTYLRFRRNSPNESFQCMSVSCVFSIPQVPLKSQNSKTEEGEQGLISKDPCLRFATEEVTQEPLEQSRRRQSSRNSKLTVKAFESLANEFWHVAKRQKKNDIIFNPCRKARTRGKTRPRRCFLDNWNAVEVQEESI